MEDFDDWYRAVAPRLFNSLALSQSSAEEANDVAAEALMKAYERWDRVRAMEHPDGWVFRVAFNLARRRGGRRAKERELLEQLPVVDRSEPADDAMIDLASLLAGLPDRMRATVVLRHVADLTEPMIAEVLGVSRGTVSSNLRDAYQRIATLLEPATEEATP